MRLTQRATDRASTRTGLSRLPTWLVSNPAVAFRLVLLELTGVVWWRAYDSWHSVYLWASGSAPTGYDLRYFWLAERAFIAHHSPYTIPGYGAAPYPPSVMILLLPLAGFRNFANATHYGLYAVLFAMIATVVISAKIIGRRAWGLTAAVGVVLLARAQPAQDEMILENMSALMGLGLAATLLLASRGRWNLAATALGVTFAIKPLLIPVVLIFVFARQWRALLVVIGIPLVLNAVAFAVVPDVGAFWHVVSPMVNMRFTADELNASIASVGVLLGMSSALIWGLRIAAGLLTLFATWGSWRWSRDPAIRLVNTTGTLLIGLYLCGSLTEDHYMLTLIPLIVATTTFRSPMRWPLAWIGVCWLMGHYMIPASTLGLSWLPALTTNRCFGLAVVLVALAAGMPVERQLARRRRRTGPGPLARLVPSWITPPTQSSA
jgi:arabinofuranan 3-O-arabinosyltransferase